MASCFMFGHSEHGVTDFYVGSRGRFDSLAATAVKRAKEAHADIQLILVLSYHPAERPVDLWGGFDGSYYPPLENVPRPYAIVRSNQYTIDTSDFLICYVKHIGNTRNFFEYARKRKADDVITNIAEE